MKTVIHWFRRDLRITDNTALAAASAAAESVIPVYIQSGWRGSHRWTGEHRQEFLCGCLDSLDRNLQSIGSRLLVRQGDAVEELARLANETQAEVIYFNRDPDPHGRRVEEMLAKKIECQGFKDHCVHERDEVLTGKNEPFRVFTPYANAWRKHDHPKAAGRLRKLHTPTSLRKGELPKLSDWNLRGSGGIVNAGEAAARERLKQFLANGIDCYGKQRDLLAEDGTSRLSQDLRFGLLSIREVLERCEEKARDLPPAGRRSAETYISELIWREFYMQVLWHWPEVLDEDFNPKYRNVPWPGSDRDFDLWKNAETGFPIVDAAMRQLRETGFMHNRARMIVAMFLTKDLHVHWRKGESWFMQQLTDGEIASNNGGWQWSAGTGADAAPYFRIQNPWSQTERFDPDGKYIKRWLPELKDVPAEKLRKPPADGKPLVRDYPVPIVDHSEERDKTLELFKKNALSG